MNITAAPRLFNAEIAVVTGAAQGIGLAIAQGLGAAGARVVLVDLDAERAASAAAQLAAAGVACWARSADVTSSRSCAALAADIAATIGPVAILVNNAGTTTPARLPDANFEAETERVFRLNVHGLFNATRAFLDALTATRGAIVNVASTSGLVAGNTTLPYASSKGAVVQATRSMARELGPRGIRVNAIAPGLTETPLAAHAFRDPARIEKMIERTDLKRMARPEDMAGPVVFLASAMANYVTGVIVPVDGGYVAT